MRVIITNSRRPAIRKAYHGLGPGFGGGGWQTTTPRTASRRPATATRPDDRGSNLGFRVSLSPSGK